MKLHQFVIKAAKLSRRKAESLIKTGEVQVNRHVVLEPQHIVNELHDSIALSGKPLQRSREGEIVLLLHKPPGFLSTDQDPEERPLVKHIFQKKIKIRLFPVGRLDFNSEGLMIFSNNGEVIQSLGHPRFQIKRTYRVKVHGNIQEKQVQMIKKGLFVPELGFFTGCSIRVERTTGKNTWVTLTLTRGRNREIRRLFQYLGLPVVRLIRTRFGPFALTGLTRGSFRILNDAEINSLHSFLDKVRKQAVNRQPKEKGE